MSKQFAKRSLATALTTAALTFVALTAVGAAEQSQDWFEQQRSVTEGSGFEVRSSAVPARAPYGARSRVGEPAASPQHHAGSVPQEWLVEQMRRGDGAVQ